MEHILFDLDGQKLAAHFDKNGFLYILDRTNMEPVRVVPFVDRIDWGEVDEKGNVTPMRLPRRGGRPGPLLARSGRREGVDARVLQPEDGAPLLPGAGRRCDGHAAAQGVQGEHPVLGRGRRGGRSTTSRAPSAPSTRAPARRGGAGATTSRCARRCWPRAAASCSPASRRVSSTRSTRRPATSCGRSSAAAATTAARHATASTASSTSPRRRGWGGWTEGFLPEMLGASPRQRAVRLRAAGLSRLLLLGHRTGARTCGPRTKERGAYDMGQA